VRLSFSGLFSQGGDLYKHPRTEQVPNNDGIRSSLRSDGCLLTQFRSRETSSVSRKKHLFGSILQLELRTS